MNNNKLVSNKLLKVILIITGWILVGLGIIGIILPVMPTTIFLILAAACFSRSSEKFYILLTTNKYLGKYIKDYMEHRAMPVRAKIIAITMINLFIGYSAIYAVELLFVKIILVITAISLTLYLLSIKTMKN